MRNICRNCGLVNLQADAICRRCGGTSLEPRANGVDGSAQHAKEARGLPVAAYFVCFAFGVCAQFVACLPVLANLGMRHSTAAAVTKSELDAQFWLFVLHLPSSILPWGLSHISEVFTIFYIVVPFTQIAFWSLAGIFVWRFALRFRNS